MRILPLFALLLIGCGGSPTAPQPQPITPAKLQIDTTAPSVLAPWTDGYTYAGKVENTGQGCATSVQGKVTFTSAQGVALETSTFTIPGTIQPQSSVSFEGCCMSTPTFTQMHGGALVATFTWTDVRC